MIYSTNRYFKRTEFPAPVPLESVLNADEAPLSPNEPVTCRIFVFFQSFHRSCLFSTRLNYSLHLCQPVLIPAVAASAAESGPFPEAPPTNPASPFILPFGHDWHFSLTNVSRLLITTRVKPTICDVICICQTRELAKRPHVKFDGWASDLQYLCIILLSSIIKSPQNPLKTQI